MTRALFLLSALLLGGEVIRFLWLHPARDRWEGIEVPRLDVAAMQAEAGFEVLPLEGNVETGPLRYDEADFLRVSEKPGRSLSVVRFGYQPGNEQVWSDLFTHNPEICMRSSGCSLERVLPARWIRLGDHEVPVRGLQYRDPADDSPLYIFRVIWLPPESPIQPATEPMDRRRLWVSMALRRIPHPPGAVLLAGLRGVKDPETAWSIFEERVASHFAVPPPEPAA